MNRKFFSLLGLAMKAGQIVSGEEMVLNMVRKQQAHLVIIATDASENTKKKAIQKANHYHVPYLVQGDREQLGRAIGKTERVLLAILDQGFAEGLLRYEVRQYRG